MMSSSLGRRWAHVTVRGLHSRRKVRGTIAIPQQLIDNLPKQKIELADEPAQDPDHYHRNPVTSAHAIDVAQGEVSTLDSVAISPSGSVVHGRYGDLGASADGIPLEFMALLKPAAEGAAAVRSVAAKGPGTVLVYGATQANGLAAVQLAASGGHAVVGVVCAEHSGQDDMVEYVKAMIPEPGTAVPEEYAMAKKNFGDLVNGISAGDEGLSCYSADECLEDFKANLHKYVEMFPEDRPAAVDASTMKFFGMEKDKDEFRANMEAYLSQYPPGAPPIDKEKLEAFFTNEQYEVFRTKFWDQTTNIISGDELHYFSPPHIVKDLINSPESSDKSSRGGAGPSVPFSFSHKNAFYPEGTKAKAGGPILGAVISVTPNLKIAADAVAAAKDLRGKAEALQFLSVAQRGAFSAACSVASVARKHGAPVYAVGGSLPGIETVEPTDEDVKEALDAMAIQDDGSTRLNYFVQVYRASDFPFYADYAVHRAKEALSGPRQIVVTK